MTVGRVRKSLDLARPDKVMTKNGKMMDTKNIGAKAKPAPEPEPEYTHDDRLSELATEHQHALEENNKLRDRLAINALPDAAEAKAEIEETIDGLRSQVSSLELELRAVTQSRNDYQQKNSDLIKQVTYWKRRAEKAEKATA
jgi:chromosome segregation ATPase